MTGPFIWTAQLLVSLRLLRLAAPAYIVLMLVVWGILLNLWLGGSDGKDRSGVVLGPDFPAFYTGGLLVRQHNELKIYDLDQQQMLQQPILPGYALSAYVNPPHYAFVAVPFTMLSYPIAFMAWSAVLMLAFATNILLMRRIVPSLRDGSGSLLMTLGLLAVPVYYALNAGPNTGLSLLFHTGVLCWLWWRAAGDLLLRYAITLCGITVIGPHLPVYDPALLILPGLVLTDRVLRLPLQEWLGLRVSLLALDVLTLCAASVQLLASLVLVPLSTLVRYLGNATRAPSSSGTYNVDFHHVLPLVLIRWLPAVIRN